MYFLGIKINIKLLHLIEFDNQYHSELMSKFLNEIFNRHKLYMIITMAFMNAGIFFLTKINKNINCT